MSDNDDKQNDDMILFDGVHKTLSGKEVLRGVDFSIKRGETMAIVGGSGTGKSVSLKHMVALMQPDEGRVIVDGEEISSAKGRELDRMRGKFGMLFQSGALLAWMTVQENIALPLYEHTKKGDDEIRELVQEKLKLVDLQGSEKKYPSEISGGMKKRVALARAIITEPQILLYDEPTSGLDPVMSRHVDQLIKDMQQELQVTSVVVTHDLHSAFAIADRITMLHEGVAAEVATPEDFAKSEIDFVQEFIKAQFESGSVKGILS